MSGYCTPPVRDFSKSRLLSHLALRSGGECTKGGSMPSLANAMTPHATLPKNGAKGALAGRVWLPDAAGPAVVAVRPEVLYDISRVAPTMRDLCEAPTRRPSRGKPRASKIGALEDVLANTPEQKRDVRKPWLLAPNDLQAIKAAGVTFPLSMLERVIEEQARGAPEKAAAIRTSVATNLGGDIRKLVPGSAQAAELKRVLIAQGAWSQYLEVGIGPDAEIFTKAPAHVGRGPRHGGGPASDLDLEQP